MISRNAFWPFKEPIDRSCHVLSYFFGLILRDRPGVKVISGSTSLGQSPMFRPDPVFSQTPNFERLLDFRSKHIVAMELH